MREIKLSTAKYAVQSGRYKAYVYNHTENEYYIDITRNDKIVELCGPTDLENAKKIARARLVQLTGA